MRGELYLVDGYSVIYRGYFAFLNRPLLSPEGRNVSSVFIFIRTLLKIVQERSPGYLAVVMDSRVPTFRHEKYPQYKATREKAPEDLHAQVPLIEEMLASLGVASVRIDRYEADDIIATLAEGCRARGRPCWILSGDKDILQLIGGNVRLLAPEKSATEVTEYSRETVFQKRGVYPEQIIDYLALTGDASDNVPGVRGIGDKTAVKLLAQFPSLKDIYTRIDEVTPESLRRKLVEGRESAFMSQDLVTLMRNVPGVPPVEALTFSGLAAATAIPFFERQGMKSIVTELEGLAAAAGRAGTGAGGTAALSAAAPASAQSGEAEGPVSAPSARAGGPVSAPSARAGGSISAPSAGAGGSGAAPLEGAGRSSASTAASATSGAAPAASSAPAVPQAHTTPGTYTAVTDPSELERWVEGARRAGAYALEVETDSPDEMTGVPLGFSLSFEEGKACYIPIRSAGVTCLPESMIKDRLARLLADPTAKLTGQNTKFGFKVLARWGVKPAAVHFDTMLAAWVLDSEAASFSLDRLAEHYLHYRTISYEELAGKKNERTLADIPLQQAADYAGEDADLTLRLYRLLSAELEKEGLSRVLFDIEMPLVRVLAEMELTGIRILPGELKAYSREMERDLAALEDEIFILCGRKFNINSTKQLQEILFTWRKLTPIRKTKTGFSTDVDVLEVLAAEDPVPEKILAHRKLSKLKSTYVDALPLLVNETTGRLHTHYVQTGAATGRLSSKDPNLQNIPIREEEGRRIRSAFVPAAGMKFLSADYAQIELAILAYLSQDPILLESFRQGQDIHRRTSSLIFGVPEAEVTPEQRRVGKTINFGVVYGMSSYGLAQSLKIPRAEAERFISTYFQLYKGVDAYLKQTIHSTEETGYSTTLMGRRRRVPAIKSRNKTERTAAERVAVNSPIQGTAADIVKLAMVKLHRRLAEEGLSSRILLQVHDELILECPEAEVAHVCELSRSVMEELADHKIPLKVQCEVGDSWGDFH